MRNESGGQNVWVGWWMDEECMRNEYGWMKVLIRMN